MIALAAWGIEPDGPRCYLLEAIRDDRASRWLMFYLLGFWWRTCFHRFVGQRYYLLTCCALDRCSQESGGTIDGRRFAR